MRNRRDRYVYGLFAGDQSRPFYIGVGKGNRLNRHALIAHRKKQKHNPRLYRLIRGCVRRGISVEARKLVIDATIDEACALERGLVSFFGRRDLKTGCLFNANAGGAGVKSLAPSALKKLAEAGRRHMARPEIRALLNERLRSPEIRAKLSASNKGRVPSVTARANMAASQRKRMAGDPEFRERFLAFRQPGGFNQGQNHTIDARKKISDALREQWSDPNRRSRVKASEHFKAINADPIIKAKIDLARRSRPGGMLGKKHSAISNAKRSQSLKESYRKKRHVEGDYGSLFNFEP